MTRRAWRNMVCAAGPRWTPRWGVLSMKEGRVSSFGRGLMGSPCWVGVSSLAHLSMASSGAVMSWVGAAPVAQFSSGPSGGQGRGGACRSKRLVGGQHVPDRFAQSAGDVDGGDLRASLVAVLGAFAGE